MKKRRQIPYPNLWAVYYKVWLSCSSVSTRQSLGMFEVKKRLVQPGLVWSRTLSILLAMNGKKHLFWLCSHSGPTLQAIFLQAAEKWTTE